METASGTAHSASVGAPAHTMRIPPAYQVAAPFGVDIGGVNPQFFPIRKEAQFDSWLTAGGTSRATPSFYTGMGCRWLPLLRDLHGTVILLPLLPCSVKSQRRRGLGETQGENVGDIARIEVDLGIGRIVALYHRSSSVYQIH